MINKIVLVLPLIVLAACAGESWLNARHRPQSNTATPTEPIHFTNTVKAPQAQTLGDSGALPHTAKPADFPEASYDPNAEYTYTF